MVKFPFHIGVIAGDILDLIKIDHLSNHARYFLCDPEFSLNISSDLFPQWLNSPILIFPIGKNIDGDYFIDSLMSEINIDVSLLDELEKYGIYLMCDLQCDVISLWVSAEYCIMFTSRDADSKLVNWKRSMEARDSFAFIPKSDSRFDYFNSIRSRLGLQ